MYANRLYRKGINDPTSALQNDTQHAGLSLQQRVDHQSIVFSRHAMGHYQMKQVGCVKQVDQVRNGMQSRGFGCLVQSITNILAGSVSPGLDAPGVAGGGASNPELSEPASMFGFYHMPFQ